MFSTVARILLTSTAIAPVGFTYAWVGYMQGSTKPAIVIAIVSVLLVIVCLWLLGYARRKLERMQFAASKVETADRENMGFLLLYLLPLFTSDFKSLDWQLWVPTIFIFMIVTATSYSYHYNPLIGMLGWHFYKVESREGVTYVLITKKQLRKAIEKIEVGQLTEYILIDLEE